MTPERRRLLERLGWVALGAALAVAVQWLVVPGLAPPDRRAALLEELAGRQEEHLSRLTVMVEERYRARHETAMAQFRRLQEFRRLATLGQSGVIVAVAGPGTGDAVAALQRAEVRLELPRAAVEPEAREEWEALVQRLEGYRDRVDARVWEAYRAVVAFAEERPWPRDASVEALGGTPWVDPAVLDRWRSLNRTLASRVDGVLALGS